MLHSSYVDVNIKFHIGFRRGGAYYGDSVILGTNQTKHGGLFSGRHTQFAQLQFTQISQ